MEKQHGSHDLAIPLLGFYSREMENMSIILLHKPTTHITCHLRCPVLVYLKWNNTLNTPVKQFEYRIFLDFDDFLLWAIILLIINSAAYLSYSSSSLFDFQLSFHRNSNSFIFLLVFYQFLYYFIKICS